MDAHFAETALKVATGAVFGGMALASGVVLLGRALDKGGAVERFARLAARLTWPLRMGGSEPGSRGRRAA
jgi:hypothetical protein